MQIPPTRLQEMRDVLKSDDRHYYSEQKDTDLSSGDSVVFQHGSGGCGEPAVHHWVLKDAQGAEVKVPIKDQRLPSASGVTIGPGGRVVGQFHKYGEKISDREVQKAKDKGVLAADATELSSYYLAEVPVRGTLPAWLRRSGVLSPKRLARLPDSAKSFDMGPDRTIAVAVDDRVLRWTKKSGLETWLQFDREVKKVEYLKDGGLAVAVTNARLPEGVDGLYFAPGSTTPDTVAFKELFPEKYEAELRSRVSNLEFLQGADVAEHERFLEHSDWLVRGTYWKRNDSLAAADRNRVAVTVAEDGPWSLHLYDRTTGKATEVGPLAHPGSLRSKAASTAYDQPASRMQWSPDGGFVLYSSKPAKAGDPVDLTVWDLRAGKPSLIPGIRDLKLEGGEIAFQALNGDAIRIPLADAPAMAEQPWYRESVVRDLLGAETVPQEAGTIEAHEEHVQVGDLQLPIRK